MPNTLRIALFSVFLPAFAMLCACSTSPAPRTDVRSQESTSAPPPSPPPGTTTHTPDAVSKPKAWHCTVHALTGDLDAFGPTQLQAYQLTLRACVQQYSPAQCQDIQCKSAQ